MPHKLTKIYKFLKPYLLSKRTWIVIGAVALDFTGIIPDNILHFIVAISVFGTKVIDTIQSTK